MRSEARSEGERWMEEAPGPWRRRSGATPALRVTRAVSSEEAAARAAGAVRS